MSSRGTRPISSRSTLTVMKPRSTARWRPSSAISTMRLGMIVSGTLCRITQVALRVDRHLAESQFLELIVIRERPFEFAVAIALGEVRFLVAGELEVALPDRDDTHHLLFAAGVELHQVVLVDEPMQPWLRCFGLPRRMEVEPVRVVSRHDLAAQGAVRPLENLDAQIVAGAIGLVGPSRF